MNILITGDSWACGAYTNEKVDGQYSNFTHKPIQVLKPLLEQDKHNVDINCYPGGSDKDVLKSLKETFKNKSYDLVIYYKTCVLRSVTRDIIEKEQGLRNAIVTLNNEVYKKLEELDCKVFLIGGLDKITKDVNVEYVLPSLPEYLLNEELGEHIDGADFFNEFKNWYYHSNFITEEDIEFANEIMMDSISAMKKFSTNNDLFPDYGHPGKEATEKFYELIKDKL